MTARAWPVLQRREVLARALAEEADGARVILLTGGAGTGRTTAAEQVASQMAGTDDVVRLVAGPAGLWVAGAAGPGPLLPHLRMAGSGDAGIEIAERSVLLVDDVHDLDGESATWLSLTLAFSDRRAVLTARDDRPLPDGLERVVVMDGSVTLAVPPLTENEAHELLGAALDAPVSREASHAAWSRSEGSPFVLRELVRAHGAALGGGREDLLRGADTSPAMAVLVRNQLEQLDDATRAALATLSVAGELPLRLAVDGFGLERLQAMEASGFVVVDDGAGGDGDRVRFRQRWRLEAVRGSLGTLAHRQEAARLRQLYRAAGDDDRYRVLATAFGVEATDAADAAAAADPVERAELREAVALAVAGEQWAIAVPLARRAVALDERWPATMALIEVLIALRSEASLTEARQLLLALRAGTWAAEVRDLSTPFLAVVEMLLGHREAAEALLAADERSAAGPAGGPAAEAVSGARAVYDLFYVSPRVAAGRLVGFATQGSSRLRLLCAAMAGDPSLAVGEVPAPEHSFGASVRGLYDGGADRATRDAYASFLATLDTPAVSVRLGFAVQAGLGQQVAGQFRSAADWFTTVISSERRSMDSLFARAGFAECGFVLGRDDWLIEAADLLSASYVELGAPMMAEGMVRRTEALRLSLQPGNVQRIRLLLGEGAQRLHDHDYLLFEADLLLMAAKLGVADRDLAGRHAAVAQQLGSPVVVEHAAASGAHVLARWDELLERCRALAALGNTFGSVALSARGAEAADRAGDRRWARALGQHADERRAGTDMAASVYGRSPAAGLARREREVARLAAEGLSSKEIAQRLALTRKTVDNTLQRAYRKLGVTSRLDLRALLTADAAALEG